jgi:ribosomal protein L31
VQRQQKMSKLFPSPIQKCSVRSCSVVRHQRKMSKLFQSSIQKCSVRSSPEVERQRKMSKLFQSPIQKCSVHSGPEVQRPCRNYFKVRSRSTAFIRVRKCSVHVEIISKSDPEVQRSFGSGSAASMSKLFQSPIQKYSVHWGPEVQRPCRNYFKVRSRSTAFIRVRKCSVHVEIISKSDPEVQRSFGSGSAASMSKVLQSPIQKYSVRSSPEVERQRKMSKLFQSPIQKCSVRSIPEVQRSFRSGSATSTKNVEIISKSDPEVRRSFVFGSAASTKNVEIISKSHPEVQRSFDSRSAAFGRFQKCSVRSGPVVRRPRKM